MVAWAIKNMGGLIPRVAARNLPDNMAVEAYNCDLNAGRLEGLPTPELYHDFSALSTTVRKAYRFPDPAGVGDPTWVPLPSEFSSVARSPLANDTNKRLYWTNPGDPAPHWNTYDNIVAGIAAFDLGIAQPSAAPTVTPTGGTATNVSRSYCYTFVNSFFEESAPSSPSSVVSAPSDATWTISGIPATAPNPVGYNYPAVVQVRVYRTITGTTTGGQFFQIGTLTLGTTSFVDSQTDANAVNNTVLASAGWGNPPAFMDGITTLPGGMLVGFTGNTVHFCEPDRPHTWPAAYDQSVHYQIVGFGVWQQSLVVLTSGYPSTGSGNSPSNYVFNQVRVPEPCISRGSIITDLMGVYYASQNGLVMLNYYGMQNQTLSAITKNMWLNEYQAQHIVACRHRAQYLAINGTGTGFLIDYAEARLGFMKLNTFNGATSVWNDEYSGDSFIMGSDKKVYRWDSPNTQPMVYRWRSKEFYSPAPISLGAAQVSLDMQIERIVATPVPGALDNGDPQLILPPGVNAMFRLFVGTRLIMTRYLTEPREIFRLPSGFKAFNYQCDIVSRVMVHSIELASTMKELKGV